MFCDNAPIWPFLKSLGATEDPEAARTADVGFYVMEVFPAIAIASFDEDFFGRLKAPRYNPGRKKTYLAADWIRVAQAAAVEARALGCEELAEWCEAASRLLPPKKANQDMLDSAICTLVAIRWCRSPRHESVRLGDMTSGYMVTPTSPQMRDRLATAARKYSVPMDGVLTV